MKVELKLNKIDNYLSNKRWPILISGPCSAETEEQVMATAQGLAAIKKVSIFRAGIWKPRTRPGAFEGVGEPGLLWLQNVKKETGLPVATEVANAQHVELCLKYGIDVLWVGARTTPNPFSIQEIADAMKGTDITLLVKNPVNPDIQLWLGALERFNKAGITKLGAIHRGVSNYEKSSFRNLPMWSMAIELKRLLPELPIICDPSHIAGNRELIPFIAQKALDLDMNGLMIESHINPDCAWSDAKQQVTPNQLADIIIDLVLRDTESKNKDFMTQLESLRKQIDEFDEEIISKISLRMQAACKIGEYKRDNNVTILQVTRWEEILKKRVDFAKALGLSEKFTSNYLSLIHSESIRIQTEIMNKSHVEE